MAERVLSAGPLQPQLAEEGFDQFTQHGCGLAGLRRDQLRCGSITRVPVRHGRRSGQSGLNGDSTARMSW
jgi:hypothetical protein